MDCKARNSNQSLISRQKCTMWACSSDEILKVPVTSATSNTLVRIPASSSWVMSESDENRFVEAPQVICLPAAKCSFLLLLTHNITSLVVDASLEMEVEDPDLDKASTKRVHSRSIKHDLSSLTQSISKTNLLSIICDFVERVGIDFQLAETEEKIWGYL